MYEYLAVWGAAVSCRLSLMLHKTAIFHTYFYLFNHVSQQSALGTAGTVECDILYRIQWWQFQPSYWPKVQTVAHCSGAQLQTKTVLPVSPLFDSWDTNWATECVLKCVCSLAICSVAILKADTDISVRDNNLLQLHKNWVTLRETAVITTTRDCHRLP